MLISIASPAISPEPYSPNYPQCDEEVYKKLAHIVNNCIGENSEFFQFMSQLANSQPLSTCLNILLDTDSATDYSRSSPNHALLKFFRTPLTRNDLEPQKNYFNPFNPNVMIGERFWDQAWEKRICSRGLSIFGQPLADLFLFRQSANPADFIKKAEMSPHDFKMLIYHPQFNVNQVRDDTFTPLTIAALRKRSDLVKALMEHPDIDPNLKDGEAQTPLNVAISSGDLASVRMILKHYKTDPNKPSGLNGEREWPPLIWAVSAGNKEMVKELLAHTKIDPLQKPKDGRSALEMAKSYHRDEITTMIQQKIDKLQDPK